MYSSRTENPHLRSIPLERQEQRGLSQLARTSLSLSNSFLWSLVSSPVSSVQCLLVLVFLSCSLPLACPTNQSIYWPLVRSFLFLFSFSNSLILFCSPLLLLVPPSSLQCLHSLSAHIRKVDPQRIFVLVVPCSFLFLLCLLSLSYSSSLIYRRLSSRSCLLRRFFCSYFFSFFSSSTFCSFRFPLLPPPPPSSFLFSTVTRFLVCVCFSLSFFFLSVFLLRLFIFLSCHTPIIPFLLGNDTLAYLRPPLIRLSLFSASTSARQLRKGPFAAFFSCFPTSIFCISTSYNNKTKPQKPRYLGLAFLRIRNSLFSLHSTVLQR